MLFPGNNNSVIDIFTGVGWDRVVGISTKLRDGRSGGWIPVGATFSALVQTDSGTQIAFCKMGTASLAQE